MINKELIEKYKKETKEKPKLTITLDQEDKDNLEKSANESGISVSFVVRIILKEFFNKTNGGN